MLRYCTNLKATRYDSTSLNRIVADKSHRVIAALTHTNGAERFGTELALVCCFVPLDEGVQGASVLVELNDI